MVGFPSHCGRPVKKTLSCPEKFVVCSFLIATDGKVFLYKTKCFLI